MPQSPPIYPRARTPLSLPSPLQDVVTNVRGRGSARRRWWLLAFMVCVSAGLPLTGPVAAATLEVPIVTIAIDDYAAVPSDQLDRAQCLVTELYAAIGVETAWLETRVSNLGSASQLRPNVVTPSLRIIVLGSQMGNRGFLSLDAVGATPGSRTERGRIAYVFYDRLRTIATAAHQDDGDSLGVVIAHELGHLLLPYGSHSETGLMRGLWSARDFRRIDLRTLAFTSSQASDIRQRVSRAFSAP
jgi:hypothetical protein